METVDKFLKQVRTQAMKDVAASTPLSNSYDITVDEAEGKFIIKPKKEVTMEEYLKSLIKDDVLQDFPKLYSHWTDTEVNEEVDKRLRFLLEDIYQAYKKGTLSNANS